MGSIFNPGNIFGGGGGSSAPALIDYNAMANAAMNATINGYPRLAAKQLEYNPYFSQQALGSVNNVAALLSGDPTQQYNLTPIVTGKGKNTKVTGLEQTPTEMTAGNDYTKRADNIINDTMSRGTTALIDTGNKINALGDTASGLSNYAAQFANGPTALDNLISSAGGNALNARADQVSMPDQIRNVSALNAYANTTGSGSLGNSLLQQAGDQLASGGRLSPEALRNASQQAASSFSQRGLGTGAGAAAAEILNRDAATNARLQQYQNFAQNVEAQDLARRQTNTAARNQFALSNQNVGMQAQLANQGADQAMNAQRLSAQQANQGANMNMLAGNRDFLINSNNAVNNSQISRGNYSIGALGNTANIYGQGGGAYQNASQLGYGGASALVNLDPMQRAMGIGVNLGTATNGQTGQMLGNYNNQMNDLASNVASFNTNMQASQYNSQNNNNAAMTGAGIGALGQLGGSYLLANAMCYVAREVYGEQNPEWMEFRSWLFSMASDRRFARYASHGKKIAAWIHTRPDWKNRLRSWMDRCRAERRPKPLS
jgi:hypothetical protein